MCDSKNEFYILNSEMRGSCTVFYDILVSLNCIILWCFLYRWSPITFPFYQLWVDYYLLLISVCNNFL